MKNTVTALATVEWTEGEAIMRAQRGDPAAFECLYRAHSKDVYSLCSRMLKNTAAAEDLTQEVFLRLFRKIGTFRDESDFLTWLHRVAVNEVLMHLRRKRSTEVLIDGLGHTGAGNNDSCELGRVDISVLGIHE